MSSNDSIIVPGDSVLVTGVNGFIGAHVASGLLGLGYRVRGTVRSAEKAEWVKEAMAQHHPTSALEVIVVPDLAASGAWDEAVEGVEGIVHVAGDMSFDADPNKVITPFVNGVRNLLEAAAKESSVKRFVLTSSNRAVWNPVFGKDLTITPTMWNEVAVRDAWHPAPYEADRIWDVYSALKTQSEQEIWGFQREKSPIFIINSVLPCLVAGPILHPKLSGSTGKMVLDTWKDPDHYDFLRQFGASWFVDVEDTALLHIAALTQEDVRNERLFGWAETFNYNTLLSVFRQLGPSKSWPADDPFQEHDLSKVNTKREVELLKRLGQTGGWTSFADSVRKTCLQSNA